jgi:hypothetical protein
MMSSFSHNNTQHSCARRSDPESGIDSTPTNSHSRSFVGAVISSIADLTTFLIWGATQRSDGDMRSNTDATVKGALLPTFVGQFTQVGNVLDRNLTVTSTPDMRSEANLGTKSCTAEAV